MKNYKILKPLLVLLLLFSSFCCFAQNQQILRHIEGLSRDFYYINIDDTHVPYIAEDIVGGEHTNIYHILGFPDETFIIVMQSIKGEASYSIHGEGFTINRRPKGDVVTIKDSHTWIRLEVSAHPYAEYSLKVKKHDF